MPNDTNMIKLSIRWGSDPDDACDETYEFATKEHAACFLFGIEEAIGWSSIELTIDGETYSEEDLPHIRGAWREAAPQMAEVA